MTTSHRAPHALELASCCIALVLGACGAAPVPPMVPPSEQTAEPDRSATPGPSAARSYPVPEGEATFDVIARPEGVRVYAAVAGETRRSLSRFDLDLDGRPTRSAPLELASEAAVVQASAIAVAAVGLRDLAVVCDQDDEGGTHYAALWIDEAGAVTERVELGAFPLEEGVDAPCFVSVAARAADVALVIHGRDSLACPRVSYDDELVQCPGYRGVALAEGRAPDDLFRVGSGDALPVLVGTTSGWAWGLGPYALRGSIVVNMAGLTDAARLLRATTVEGFLASDDTLVALGRNEDDDTLVATAFRDGAVLTGDATGGRDDLPSIEAALTLGCADGAVSASVQTATFGTTVRAGELGSSVPWRLLIPRDLPGPTGAPQGGFATASGRVFHATFDGELEIVRCDGDVVTTHATTWRTEE